MSAIIFVIATIIELMLLYFYLYYFFHRFIPIPFIKIRTSTHSNDRRWSGRNVRSDWLTSDVWICTVELAYIMNKKNFKLYKGMSLGEYNTHSNDGKWWPYLQTLRNCIGFSAFKSGLNISVAKYKDFGNNHTSWESSDIEQLQCMFPVQLLRNDKRFIQFHLNFLY